MTFSKILGWDIQLGLHAVYIAIAFAISDYSIENIFYFLIITLESNITSAHYNVGF